MDANRIRSFTERRWDLVEREKIRARARRYRRGGSAACHRAAAELRERWRRRHPTGPDPRSRREDLSDHVELSAKLAEISNALARSRR